MAIELNDACREAIQSALEELKPVVAGVRWVKPQAMHLTLKFIGQLDEADLPRAVECLQGAAAGSAPFTMAVSGLSGFPPRGTPRVVHVEVREPTGTVLALQREVDAALARELGIPREKRQFTPHVTLGRVKDRRACPKMDVISGAVADQDFGEVAVDCMVLMKSDLRPDGAIYTRLHSFALGG